MSKNRSGSSFVGGLLLGTAIGAVTGLLFAPRKGKETRQLLKKATDALPELAEDLSSNVHLQADRLSSSAFRGWDGTLVRLREAVRAGLEAARLDAAERELSKPAAQALTEPGEADNHQNHNLNKSPADLS